MHLQTLCLLERVSLVYLRKFLFQMFARLLYVVMHLQTSSLPNLIPSFITRPPRFLVSVWLQTENCLRIPTFLVIPPLVCSNLVVLLMQLRTLSFLGFLSSRIFRDPHLLTAICQASSDRLLPGLPSLASSGLPFQWFYSACFSQKFALSCSHLSCIVRHRCFLRSAFHSI
jgi:hypothetical protein